MRGERTLTVQFDANVAPGLPWKFEPEVASIKARTGDMVTVFYKLTNLSDQPTAGTAMYNVGPDAAGAWFNKIACFCFEELKVGPRETLELPVVFFLDPALEKHSSARKAPRRSPLSARRNRNCERARSRAKTKAARPEGRRNDEMADAHSKPNHDYHLVDPSIRARGRSSARSAPSSPPSAP